MEAAVVDDSTKDTAVSNQGGRKRHRNENEHRADQTDIGNATDGKARTFDIKVDLPLSHVFLRIHVLPS